MIYYNENNREAATWLRVLMFAGAIPWGDVDERSIVDVKPADVRKYTQCHFFAGIGGWAEALRLARWPVDRPIWTGSCPCQPFSQAGRQLGEQDERHIWPTFRRLIAKCRPAVVAGEQVASALGRQWLSRVRFDMEGMAYGLGAADLCAAGESAPHIRQRLYWLADTNSSFGGQRRSQLGRSDSRSEADAWCGSGGSSGFGRLADDVGVGREVALQQSGHGSASLGVGETNEPRGGGAPVRLANADGRIAGNGNVQRSGQYGQQSQNNQSRGLAYGDDGGQSQLAERDRRQIAGAEPSRRHDAIGCRSVDRMGDANDARSQGWLDGSRQGGRADQWLVRPTSQPGDFWSAYDIVPCTDGAARRFEPGSFPLADGVPGRVGLLRGYGNAIVPQVAASFLATYLELVDG